MTLSIEQFREQLVDYLYGELEGEPLREFEASLRASEPCRRELESMKETLRISREGVAALRTLDAAPPPRVNAAIVAAAAGKARELVAEPSAALTASRAAEPRSAASSLWSWLRTPWVLPTLGVAAAVSVVVLHKRVESPKMSGYESASEQRSEAPPSVPAAPPAGSYEPQMQPSVGADERIERGEGQADTFASAGPRADHVAPSKGGAQVESKRERAARARPADVRAPAERVGASSAQRRSAELADEAVAAPSGAFANGQGAAATGYAEPPPAWAATRGESAPKTTSATRPKSAVSAEREAAPQQDDALAGLSTGSAGRGGGGAALAKKPSAPASQLAPAAPPAVSATAPSTATENARPAVAAEPSTRAPDESVKRALEHMTARRFSQAAVAYRELLARYPKDARAPFFRKQLTAAMQALSNVDSTR